MSEANHTGPKRPGAAFHRAVNTMRSAGSATVVCGGLIIVFTLVPVVLQLGSPGALVLGLGLATGVLLIFLGVMALGMRTWSPWAAIAIGAVLLGGQLWSTFMGPEGATPSVFLLIIPLIVLVANGLAVNAARRLPPNP